MDYIVARRCFLALLLLCTGCMRPQPPAPRATETPAAETPAGEEGFTARLEAAQGISTLAKRDDALVQLAQDAADGGNGEVVKKAVALIQNVSTRDDAAFSAALRLAKSAKGDDAVAVAKMIMSLDRRDEALARIAKGDTGE
jgi:hypothetical protein